jgi:hypothetical protein
MAGQLIPLAVLSAITSPTAIAAVLLILHRPQPTSLLAAYVAGSLAASMLVGIAVVAILNATDAFTPGERGTSRPILYIVAGVLILASTAFLQSERSAELRRRSAERLARRRVRRQERRSAGPSRTERILNRGSIGLVAALGVAMHLPGLLYLVALGDIASTNLDAAETVIVLILFNLVMLLPIELPLLGCLIDPAATESAVKRFDALIHSHQRAAFVIASIAAGGYLIVSGVLALA